MEMAPMGSYELEVVRVTSSGRRYYGRAGKARLVEACLEPGISVARLALEHGVNANMPRHSTVQVRIISRLRSPERVAAQCRPELCRRCGRP